jgi:acetyl esterase/lipase
MKTFILFACLVLFCMNDIYSQTVIPLYDKIPNSKPSTEVKEKTETGKDGLTRISQVTDPTLTVFVPKNPNGTAVVICPGGGYWIVAIDHEGYQVAKKFNEMGVTAFVLKYRLPDERISPLPEIAPLQDAQRAIQIVRQRAKDYKINPDKVGIMGFSAGGHLASTAGTQFQKALIDNIDNINLRPDFMVLAYPVISGDTNIAHKGSHEKLLGKNASAEKRREFSSEKQVTPQTPPTFLVHATDDSAVKPENSVVFYLALRKNNVPSEMHIYQKGGHGFGLNNKTTADSWFERLANWMKAGGWTK